MGKLVIFDIDRTIYDGSIFLDFSLHLIQKNLISAKYLSTIGFEFVTYETGFESYDELVRDCLNYFFEHIKQLDIDLLKKELKECLFKNHHKFYDYVFSTIKEYPEYNYVLVSLEPDFIVQEVANFLKIENFASNKFIEDNKFVNEPSLIFNKLELLNLTKYKDQIPFAAFGDSESDYDIVLKAENKFYINPTLNLQKKLKNNNQNTPFYTENNIKEAINKLF